MADWSQLPKDLLQLILEKLNCEIYVVRFRSVCSTWRFSIPKPHYRFPFNLPHFSDSNDFIVNKLEKHSIFLIKSPTTSNPWLVRISPTPTGKFNLRHPLLRHSLIIPSDPGVLDFSQLSVFNIGQMYNLSSTGGHDSWTKIPNEANFYHDICNFKGRPCVAEETGRTVMIGSDLSVHLVAEPVCDGYLYGDVNIMVENESELLLVHKYDIFNDYLGTKYHVEERVGIDVFRLDQKEKKWLKLANLGDTVVFFGQCDSFSASASDLGFDKGNFVIYWNDDDDVKNKISIFHLDTQRNFPLSDYPDYLKLFWPPPEWIVSRIL